jgi:hypothetical protein
MLDSPGSVSQLHYAGRDMESSIPLQTTALSTQLAVLFTREVGAAEPTAASCTPGTSAAVAYSVRDERVFKAAADAAI